MGKKPFKRWNICDHDMIHADKNGPAFEKRAEEIWNSVFLPFKNKGNEVKWARCCKTFERDKLTENLGHDPKCTVSLAKCIKDDGLHDLERVKPWLKEECQHPAYQEFLFLPTVNMRHYVPESPPRCLMNQKDQAEETEDLPLEREEAPKVQELQTELEKVKLELAKAKQEHAIEKEELARVKMQLTTEREQSKKTNQELRELEYAKDELENDNCLLRSKIELQQTTYHLSLSLLEQQKAVLISDKQEQTQKIKAYVRSYNQIRRCLDERDLLLGKRCQACQEGRAEEQERRQDSDMVSLMIKKQYSSLTVQTKSQRR